MVLVKFMILISSSQNSVIKEIKSLKSRKDREEKGLYYVEGLRIVEEALKESADIKEVAVSEGLAADYRNDAVMQKINSMNIKTHLLASKVFKEIGRAHV